MSDAISFDDEVMAIAAKALRDCRGNRDATILLLASLLRNAQRGMSAGLLRLGPPEPGPR